MAKAKQKADPRKATAIPGFLIGGFLGVLGGLAYAGWEAALLLWSGYPVPHLHAVESAVAAYGVFGGVVGASLGALGLWGTAWAVAMIPMVASLLLCGRVALLLWPRGVPLEAGCALTVTVGFLAAMVLGRARLPAQVMKGFAAGGFVALALLLPVNLHLLASPMDSLSLAVDGFILLLAFGAGMFIAAFSGEGPPVFALLLAGAVGWGGAWLKVDQQGELWPVATEEQRPLVIVAVDGLRADWVNRDTEAHNRNLRALARQSLWIRQGVAVSSWSVPSLSTLLTGTMPYEHGAGLQDGHHNHNGPLRTDVPVFAEELKRAGYVTAAVTGDPWLHNYGLNRGFDRWSGVNEAGPLPVLAHAWSVVMGDSLNWRVRNPAEEVTDRAVDYIDRQEKGGWALWVHYVDLNAPFHYRLEDAADVGGVKVFPEDAYRAAMRRVDHSLGRLLESVPDEALVMVVGTHGTELGEGRARPGGMPPFARSGHNVHAELVDVPWIIRDGGRTELIESPRSLVHLSPTALDLLGLPPMATAMGTPLSELGAGLEAQRAVAQSVRWGSETQMVQEGDMKLVVQHDGTWALYDRTADPNEATAMAPAGASVDQTKRKLRRHLPISGGSARFDEAEPLDRRAAAWAVQLWSQQR